MDLAHGTITEGTTAAATVTEQRVEAGYVTSRSLTGSFDLSIGRVDVYAEWFCPDGNPKSWRALSS